MLKSEYKTFMNWFIWRYSSSKVEKKNAQHYPNFSYKVLLPFFWNVFNSFPPILSHISCLNYVRPDFSRMRYVGGLCRPLSFLYQNFLFWLILERRTTFDLIPAPMGYVGATTARSYTQKIFISLHNGNWDRIFERISKIHLKLDFFNKSKQKTKILRRLALGGSQKLRQSSLQLGQNFWDDLKNSTNVICYLLR